MMYEDIIAQMPCHVYWVDRDNILLGCNKIQAQDLGFSSSKEVVGKSVYDILMKHDADAVVSVNNSVMETGIPRVVEEIHYLPDREVKYLSHKVPLRDESNNIIGVLGISVRVSE